MDAWFRRPRSRRRRVDLGPNSVSRSRLGLWFDSFPFCFVMMTAIMVVMIEVIVVMTVIMVVDPLIRVRVVVFLVLY